MKTPKQQQMSGFTLVEIMVSLTIFGLVFSGLLSSFVFTSKSTFSLGNYADMVRESTYFLESFGREVRMAEDVNAIGLHGFSMDVAYPNGTQTIEYEYLPASDSLIRRVGGVERIILTDVDWITFKYYNILNAETSALLEVKSVQMEAILEKRVMQRKNTDHIISARFMMRNRTVSN